MAGRAALWDSAHDHSLMPRSTSARQDAISPPSPPQGRATTGQLNSQIQWKTEFAQVLLLLLLMLMMFCFGFQGQVAKKSDCCEQGPHKLVMQGCPCPQHPQAPAPSPGASSELRTIPKGNNGLQPQCDLFLHQGLPTQLPAEKPGVPLVPCHGCNWEGDKEGGKRRRAPPNAGGKKEMEEEEKQSKAAAGGHQCGGGYSWLLRDLQNIPAWTLTCLIPQPGPKVLLCSLTEPHQSLPVNTQAHSMHTWFGRGIQLLTPPPGAGTRHTGCDLWSHSSRGTPHSPPWLEVRDTPDPLTHSHPISKMVPSFPRSSRPSWEQCL